MEVPTGDGDEFVAKWRSYQKALEQEWEVQQPHEEDSAEELEKKARKLVIQALPQLVERATLLALGASSEATSLSAVKFLYEIIVPKRDRAPGEKDPMEALINELTKKERERNPQEPLED